ncbi:nuclease [Burkholderia stagnalis]|uniref:Nuclease n=1 Tax=Burkholderia stagnalis TaxID=1503054 RepID=A0ABX9YQN6_9BURK|nr:MULTISPECIES: ParB N-terminal domain-containing protein [Burkholderia]MDD1493928.1 nuclease [Burkholderia thailandensis]RQY93859.1 nuclease [Burkholderia stagnalis]RQZ19580.1 nuclease [Burkholderia stagnalis]
MQQENSGRFSSLSMLTRAATASARAAEIEKATGAITKVILIAKVRAKPQVRDDFSDVPDFAERAKVVGHIHTPILVREIKDEDEYELIAGERRIRASKLNGWAEIQAKIFPADTPYLIIRLYQVSENVDRKPFSLRETATGLAADVERFGRDEAARIWTAPSGKQRSASWISKHLRYLKYGPISRALFDENLFDDVEAANKLADIESVSTETAAEIAAEMRVGRKIGRLTLDARLSMLKHGGEPASPAIAEQGAQTAALPDANSAPASPALPVAAGARAGTGVGAEDAQVPDGSLGSAISAQTPDRSTGAPAVSGGESGSTSPNVPPRAKQQRSVGTDPKKTVVWRVEEIFEIGTGSIERFRNLSADLSAAGLGPEDVEWKMWVGFVDLAASALVGMGTEIAGKIINRFNAELNSSGPLELLNRLHPSRTTSVMPDDFRYDTDREIHPLAPGDWAL